ncbi:MAG TPA: hypothetical protein VFK48_00490 [Usitatibacter sp.]|nr:hypothetical protein [Usitatibacter sp.]
MKNRIAACLLPLAFAPLPAASQDSPPEYRDRSEQREAYRRGYEAGFERGFQKGLEQAERRAPPVVAPPPPRTGPIRVSGAYYGTTSRSCDATRYVASRANGKRSFSFAVSNNICGDPAKGDRKSLEVTYYCGDVSKTASANEHRTIYLDCGS